MEKTMNNREKLMRVMAALDTLPVQSKPYVMTMAGVMQILEDVISSLPEETEIQPDKKH